MTSTVDKFSFYIIGYADILDLYHLIIAERIKTILWKQETASYICYEFMINLEVVQKN